MNVSSTLIVTLPLFLNHFRTLDIHLVLNEILNRIFLRDGDLEELYMKKVPKLIHSLESSILHNIEKTLQAWNFHDD